MLNISGVDRLHDSLLLTISGMFFKTEGGFVAELMHILGGVVRSVVGAVCPLI